MFNISVLSVNLMSQGLRTVEIIQIYLILIETWEEMWWSWKKRENALLEKMYKSNIQLFSFQTVR